MKFSCEKHILQSAVSVCSRAAAAKSPISALEGILLEAGERLRVTGYDLKRVYILLLTQMSPSPAASFSMQSCSAKWSAECPTVW